MKNPEDFKMERALGFVGGVGGVGGLVLMVRLGIFGSEVVHRPFWDDPWQSTTLEQGYFYSRYRGVTLMGFVKEGVSVRPVRFQ